MIDMVEKERDFYYAKLRDIEDLCISAQPNSSGSPVIQRVLDILYNAPAENAPSNPIGQALSDSSTF